MADSRRSSDLKDAAVRRGRGFDRRTLLRAAAALLASPAVRREEPQDQSVDADPTLQDLVQPRMRDGVRLAATLRLPAGEGPFPVVIMRTLDRRREADPARVPTLAALRHAGYAVLAADLRGRCESEGVFDPNDLAGEARDAADLADWAAGQPWCDQRLATLGREPPPGSRVNAAVVWGPGPAIRPGALIEALSLVAEAGPAALDRLAAQGRDVAAARAALQLLAERPEEVYGHLPLRDCAVARVEPFASWLAPRLFGAGPPPAYPRGSRPPTLTICGWYDPSTSARLAAARGSLGDEMILGPWAQALGLGRRLGQVSFGASADSDGSGVPQRIVRFLDRTVRDAAGPPAPIRYFTMGANVWRETAAWPPPHVARHRLYLRSEGKANSVAGDGVLSPDCPGGDPSDRFVYDPARPVPTLGGAIAGGLGDDEALRPGPVEQSPLERRPDVLCYTTAPFVSRREISGPVTLRLYASTSAAGGDFTGRLTHVYPDGASINLCEGIVRLAGVAADASYELTLELGHVSVEVDAGHRLRLQVSSSNFPQFDRNMGTGRAPGVDAQGVVAEQAVHHRRGRASYLEVLMSAAPGRA
jgi:predicted acyl esterase